MNFGIDIERLISSIRDNHQRGNRTIGLISVKRMGLRYKFNHAFIGYCGSCKPIHQHELRDITQEVRKEMSEYVRNEKDLYFYTT